MNKLCIVMLFVSACAVDSDSEPAPAPQPQPTPTSGELRVTNYSTSDVLELYIAPCTADSWGQNRGGITKASSSTFTVQANCYDLQAVGEGDREWSRTGVAINAGTRIEWELY